MGHDLSQTPKKDMSPSPNATPRKPQPQPTSGKP